MDKYRSWTKVNWTKTGLDENRVGRKKLDENRLDENRLDENWAHGHQRRTLFIYMLTLPPFIACTRVGGHYHHHHCQNKKITSNCWDERTETLPTRLIHKMNYMIWASPLILITYSIVMLILLFAAHLSVMKSGPIQTETNYNSWGLKDPT